MSIKASEFGKMPDGTAVSCHTLSNKHGVTAEILSLGGIVRALRVPDRNGRFADVVLGKDTLDEYLAGHPHFGCITGRTAGRITGATFSIDGERYTVDANEGANCLHGGGESFAKMVWTASVVEDSGVEKLRLSLRDPDGHNGFPGNVDCAVTYALYDDNTFEIHYAATTDQPTPLNLTNHSYFNLAGAGSRDVLGHEVTVFADAIAPSREDQSLTGEKAPVRAGHNDFRKPVRLADLAALDTANADTHYFLPEGRTPHPKQAAAARDPESGRRMEVFTTEPGVQFYAGLLLEKNGPVSGKDGASYRRCHGLCFETQDYPDAVNHPDLGDAVLRPGETRTSTTLFRFKTDA